MTSTAVPPPARPVLHGLKALAGAQSALPATCTAAVTGGPLEYVRAGDGEPAVVLIGGVGLPIEGWALVLPRVVEISTVVACNRRGVGASAEPQRPQTATVVAGMLRELLDAIGVKPPYVLVGQGTGGLFANLFARRFSREVAGVVLVEATHPDDDIDERRLRFLPRSYRRPAGSRKGARRYDELHFLGETAREIESAGPFPDLPLTVVSGSRTPPRWAMSPQQIRTHAARQKQLITLSPRGAHVVAPASGHFPQVTDHETVARAVSEMVAGLRA